MLNLRLVSLLFSVLCVVSISIGVDLCVLLCR